MSLSKKQIGHYQIIRKIGSGQFSDVYEVVSLDDQKHYAAKCISKSLFQNNDKLKELFKTEVSIM